MYEALLALIEAEELGLLTPPPQPAPPKRKRGKKRKTK